MLLEALRGLDARAVIVGFGDYRGELEAARRPGAHALHRPARAPAPRHLLPLADVAVVPSIFPEAFGMVAAEAAAAGCPPLVARHSGLAEVAAGLEAEYPPELRHLASFANGDAADLRGEARDACSRCRPASGRRSAAGRRAGGRQRWSWAGIAARPARASLIACAISASVVA